MTNNNSNKILVFYVGVLPAIQMNMETNNYVKEVLTRVGFNEKGYHNVVVIPVHSYDSRIECIDPQYITEEELCRKHNLLLSELNEHLAFQLEEFKINKNVLE